MSEPDPTVPHRTDRPDDDQRPAPPGAGGSGYGPPDASAGAQGYQQSPSQQGSPAQGSSARGSTSPGYGQQQGYAQPGYSQQAHGPSSSSSAGTPQGQPPGAYPAQGGQYGSATGSGGGQYGARQYGGQYAGSGDRDRSRPMDPADERTWSVFAHLSSFLGLVVGFPLLGPLVIYLIFKDRGPFVRRHSAEALNFQISVLIYAVVGGILGVVLSVITLGIGAIPFALAIVAFIVAWVAFVVIAAVRAGNGEEYSYPLTIHMVS